MIRGSRPDPTDPVERPRLSVVMPVHAGERWLDAALASVTTSEEFPVEIVIRDSTPGQSCEAIVGRHAARIAIDYAYMPDVASWTRKTNFAVKAARAEHIAMLHQDDLWLPDRLAVVAALIAHDPEAALLLTAAEFVDDGGRSLGRWRPPFAAGSVPSDSCRNALLVQNSIALPAPVFRRDAYLAAGGLDENLWYTPDWDLWLKLARAGRVNYDPRATVAFRIHGTSLTMTGSRDVADFRAQLETVLARHRVVAATSTDRAYQRCAAASIEVNCALAKAAAGESNSWLALARTIAGLGPVGLWRYIRLSGIIARAVPRLKLRLSGAL